jgi:hypothetical protein
MQCARLSVQPSELGPPTQSVSYPTRVLGGSHTLLRGRGAGGPNGHEQPISNGERFKPAFVERDKKQTMTDLREISTNSYVPPQGFLGYGL